MKAKTWAPIATFVTVAAVGVTVALVGGDGGGSKHLKQLGLTGHGSDAARSAVGAPTVDQGAGGSSGYQVTGTLSDEQPADAPVWTLAKGPADKELVDRLAAALKAGTPVREGSGWRVGGLSVSGDAGQAWSWYRCGGPDTAVSSDGSRVGCVTAVAPTPASGSGSGSSSSGSAGAPATTPATTPDAPQDTPAVPPPGKDTPPSPAPEPDPVADAVVEDGARAVFAALGLDVDDATVDTWAYGGQAWLDGTVGGLAASGLTTRVEVDRDGKPMSASGFLGDATKGDSYPLMSAKEAFEQMPVPARPDICMQPKDGSTGCAEPEPVQITGATLGLSLQYTKDGQLLVPSWLYAVKGGGVIPAVAVEKQYWPSDEPTDKPGTTDPGANEPGTEPAPPSQVDPAAPRQLIAVTGWQPGKTADSLLATYENGGCGQKNVTAAAKETDEAVYVALEADTPPADQVCTADSRPAQIAVALQQALGDRTVYDASTNRPAPR